MIKKQNRYTYRFNSVFIRTFALLIISSIIPVLAVNVIIYRQSISTIKKQAQNVNMNMLDKTGHTVDLVFKQLNQIIPQLGNDPLITNMIINPDVGSISSNNKIISNLKNISSTNDYILSIYIYSAYSNTILSSSGGIYSLDDFYDQKWFEYYGSVLLGTYRLETRIVSDALGNEYNCITLIRNLPYSSWSKMGAIVINISEDKLYNTISGLDSESKGEFYVINKKGYILSHKDKSMLYTNISSYPYAKKILDNDRGYFIENIKGKQMLLTYVTSPFNVWKYIYSIPLEDLQSGYKMIPLIIIITTLIYILIGFTISFIVSKGIYYPLEKLVNMVSSSSGFTNKRENIPIKNEYELLGYAYSDVMDKNRNMEDIINKLKPVIKEKLFINLIMGKSDNLQEINERLSLLGIKFDLNNFVVMAVQIDSYNEFRSKYDEMNIYLYKIKLIDTVERIIYGKYKSVCIETEFDQVASIINLSDNEAITRVKEELVALAENIKDSVEKSFPFTITLGIGRVCKDIGNIKSSYTEALNALKYKLYQGKNEIINIDDINVEIDELYYYDTGRERMLLNYLKVGNYQKVEMLLEELLQEFMDNRNNSYAYVQQVLMRIISSIIELVINIGMTVEEVFGSEYNLYNEFSKKETLNDINIWLKYICHSVIDAVNSINITKSHINAEKILEYINDNLSRDISLNEIADWIGLSPAYVSKIFKDNIGRNYVDYLSESRIEKAKQFLKNTQLPIKEIGFKVGFNSIQTFMRTFKKHEAISPGQYRDRV